MQDGMLYIYSERKNKSTLKNVDGVDDYVCVVSWPSRKFF